MMPITTNKIWSHDRFGRTYLNPKYRDFKNFVLLTLGGKRLPDSWPFCSVKITIHPPRRIGDADNYIKGIFDALTFAGFWKDDRQVAEVCARFGAPDKDKRGCVLVEVERRAEKFTDEEEESFDDYRKKLEEKTGRKITEDEIDDVYADFTFEKQLKRKS